MSSGVVKSPAYTMELLYQTVRKLRIEFHFQGYIHLKTIPGAPPELIEKAGFFADRMSVNLEFPTADGLRRLAPHKTRKAILGPMRQIQQKAKENKKELALLRRGPRFVPAGQSTQMIIGAAGESDYQILTVAEALYRQFEMKRVFFSAFVNVNMDSTLPMVPRAPILLREHRLYQADWLLRFYGFEARELLSPARPDFNVLLDPKCDWALRHLDQFPVEVNRADYNTLLRVPGIGVRSAGKIVRARRYGTLTFEDLKKMRVVLKRAVYFITCKGKMMYRLRLDEDYILRNLLDSRDRIPVDPDITFRQLSLFDGEGAE